MRSRGFLARVVEHWNHFAKIRQDLWGLDILCIRDHEIVGVQTTSASNVAARIKKLANAPETPLLRKAGIGIEVHGWKKVKNRWTVRVVDVS